MPRFFTQNIHDGVAVITGEDARHISLSLRCREGEELELCDGAGTDHRCAITGLAPDAVTLRVLESRASRGELPCRVTLYQAMPKGDKLDFIVQKAVELGAQAIVPVLTSRCVARPDPKAMAKKRERLEKIALEAAKQSGRGRIPQVEPLLGYREALERMAQAQVGILFYENADRPLGELLSARPQSIAVLVGAEGGFSPEEAEEARERGLALCTMGPRILRCETAALYALSAIGYHYENYETR